MVFMETYNIVSMETCDMVSMATYIMVAVETCLIGDLKYNYHWKLVMWFPFKLVFVFMGTRNMISTSDIYTTTSFSVCLSLPLLLSLLVDQSGKLTNGTNLNDTAIIILEVDKSVYLNSSQVESYKIASTITTVIQYMFGKGYFLHLLCLK